ncbi:MAG: ABC transporter ATP-binding protein [Clostridiales bacterium]|nr:ABC transporter ATP-binding protein [Clostridiales bacterium]
MILELRDVSCGYAKNKPVLKNITFTLQDGEICALLGPNGVGKTTLFKTILNLIKPLSGQVCIDGSDITKWTTKRRSRYMAYVAQAHVPSFPYLVKDIAMLGRMGQTSAVGQPSRKDYEIVEQALEDVGIRHLRDAVYTEISGGERQLLMIARALAQEPKILIMDEPTANLDYGNMIVVMKCIRNLARNGLCIIFTTHMPDQAFMCHAKTAVLFRNAPMVFGDAHRVITEENLYKAYNTDIEVLEVLDAEGNPIRLCTPGFSHRQENER